MAILLYILVVMGALFVMAGGVWVAWTLAKVISTKRNTDTKKLKK